MSWFSRRRPSGSQPPPFIQALIEQGRKGAQPPQPKPQWAIAHNLAPFQANMVGYPHLVTITPSICVNQVPPNNRFQFGITTFACALFVENHPTIVRENCRAIDAFRLALLITAVGVGGSITQAVLNECYRATIADVDDPVNYQPGGLIGWVAQQISVSSYRRIMTLPLPPSLQAWEDQSQAQLDDPKRPYHR